MLRSQYGVATSSSVTPAASHAEDAQPNEVIYKRRHGRPPQIGSTWKNNYGDSGIQRGGYNGLWTEYGMRGNSSRRGRGNFQPNRGGHNSNQRQTGQVHQSTHHNKPLLPGRNRRFEVSSPVHALHSAEPQAQVETAASSTVPSILAETSTIKKEPRTPSPAHSRMERTLITSSCKFYPIPEFCKKTFPDFKENRNAFFKEKMQELTRLGLTKVKSFFRDDGLAIEWKSKVPVWSDTLLPEFPDLASAIKRAHQMNHQTSSPKRKRQSVERHSRDSSLKDNNNYNMEPNESKHLRHSLENSRLQDRPGEDMMSFRNSSSPTPMSFFDHSDHPSTTIVPLPSKETPELICLDLEVIARLGDSEDSEPTSIIPQHNNTSPMDVDRPTPIQPPKPVRRMLFKPNLPGRRNQSKISTVQNSTLLTSNSTEPPSTSLSVTDGHSKKDELEVTSRAQDVVLRQEKPISPRPRTPLPSRNCMPTPSPLPPRHNLNAQKAEVPDTRVSLSKDGNATDTSQAQDVVLLQEKPTSPRPRAPLPSRNCMPTPPSLPRPHHLNAQKAEVPNMRVSLSKDGNATDTDTEAELVVDLLLRGTPEDPYNSICISNPLQLEIAEDLPLHRAHNDKDDKDGEVSVSAVKDTAAVEGLATRFLQQYLQLFDVDRLKLEAAYAKNALFSCRIHHVQEPSFSMAGLFAPESSRSRQGFNMSPIEKGRAQIVNRLLELGPHRFCPRGVPRTVDYNVVTLPSSTGGGILLTVHGEVVNPHLAGPKMDHILYVDQNFVLRKRELEEEEDEEEDGFGLTISSSASNRWPLVAVSHQMTVRDAVPLQEQSDGLISQIQGS